MWHCNGLDSLYFNFKLNNAAFPYGMASQWGNEGIQFTTLPNYYSPWQAYQMQQIHNGAHWGIPTSPFSFDVKNAATQISQSVNDQMNQQKYQAAETTLKTLTDTQSGLEKMLTQEGVTSAQKEDIKKYKRQIEELKAELIAFKEETKTGKNWGEMYDKFEVLLGKKAEIDSKITELIEEVAKANEKVEERREQDANLGNGQNNNEDDGNDSVHGEGYSAQHTTKTDAENALNKIYGENNTPTGVNITDDGKYSVEYKNNEGQTVTKTYSTVKEMVDAAINRHPQTKKDAERDLKIVAKTYDVEDITVKEESKNDRETKIVYTYKNAKFDTITGALEAKAKETETKAKLGVASSGETFKTVTNEEAEGIATSLLDAIKGQDAGLFRFGTKDGKLSNTLDKLDANNIVEVLNAYDNMSENPFIKDLLNDTSNNDEHRVKIETRIWNPLVSRYAAIADKLNSATTTSCADYIRNFTTYLQDIDANENKIIEAVKLMLEAINTANAKE